jgi:DNA-binding MarR family transcriptional regulator
MHALFFGMKRAFHASLRITRKALKSFGLTAARFDLMWALTRPAAGYMRQSDLRRLLGVTAPTVSRMVKSLQALGLVRAERSQCGDRRQCLVELTETGLERIRAAAALFIDGRVAKRILERVLGRYPVRGRSRAEVIFHRMCDFEDMLRWTRETCGDTAMLRYPWHPDD